MLEVACLNREGRSMGALRGGARYVSLSCVVCSPSLLVVLDLLDRLMLEHVPVQIDT